MKLFRQCGISYFSFYYYINIMTNENKAIDKYNIKTCVSNYIEKLQSTYSNLIQPLIFYRIHKFMKLREELSICLLRFTVYCQLTFFFLLCCLFFFNIQILNTPLISSNSSYTRKQILFCLCLIIRQNRQCLCFATTFLQHNVNQNVL